MKTQLHSRVSSFRHLSITTEMNSTSSLSLKRTVRALHTPLRSRRMLAARIHRQSKKQLNSKKDQRFSSPHLFTSPTILTSSTSSTTNAFITAPTLSSSTSSLFCDSPQNTTSFLMNYHQDRPVTLTSDLTSLGIDMYGSNLQQDFSQVSFLTNQS